jgi:hypothetical protein
VILLDERRRRLAVAELVGQMVDFVVEHVGERLRKTSGRM